MSRKSRLFEVVQTDSESFVLMNTPTVYEL
jgi:hypothetical protein